MSGCTLSVELRVTRPPERSGARFSLDVAFEVPPGTTVLIGPSGAGKTTTLAAVAGLVRPREGRVALGDEVLFDSDRGVDRPTHTLGIAFVFQSLALFPHMTAASNVAYGVARTVAAPERRRRARDYLARLGVERLADRKPATFSGGEAQRVALARAFAASPRVALFDEPFSALDPELRAALVADVRAFVADLGIPAIHVTHDRSVARRVADRVLFLDGGRVVRAGAAGDLLPGPEPPDR